MIISNKKWSGLIEDEYKMTLKSMFLVVYSLKSSMRTLLPPCQSHQISWVPWEWEAMLTLHLWLYVSDIKSSEISHVLQHPFWPIVKAQKLFKRTLFLNIYRMISSGKHLLPVLHTNSQFPKNKFDIWKYEGTTFQINISGYLYVKYKYASM